MDSTPSRFKSLSMPTTDLQLRPFTARHSTPILERKRLVNLEDSRAYNNWCKALWKPAQKNRFIVNGNRIKTNMDNSIISGCLNMSSIKPKITDRPVMEEDSIMNKLKRICNGSYKAVVLKMTSIFNSGSRKKVPSRTVKSPSKKCKNMKNMECFELLESEKVPERTEEVVPNNQMSSNNDIYL
ncbi:uncharacterized protein LOC115876335 [Sitophilus oryzae]|uniref:Uncharacterized protein LOC115876335 n=1 Tax=Sitophilus oryzae TaxID=7048 RepID=A0A6J2XAS3_SITOR|nr:uncharacterized protein LOC115876335 [Sitophilus oryzae]